MLHSGLVPWKFVSSGVSQSTSCAGSNDSVSDDRSNLLATSSRRVGAAADPVWVLVMGSPSEVSVTSGNSYLRVAGKIQGAETGK
ncbi:hypothetical protein GCM10025787_15190 [Saccharopolyspora rosea]